MKSKKILLPLIFTVFSLAGCDIGKGKGTITFNNGESHTDIGYGGDKPSSNTHDIIEPSAKRLKMLELYQPESLRGFENAAQLTYNAYLARQYAISKNRTYDETPVNAPDANQYYFDLDEDYDGEGEVLGYPIYEESSYRFENFTYFDFDVSECDFIEKFVGLGRIHALIVESGIFGETMLVLNNGLKYYACAEIGRTDGASTFGTYKHLDHFFLCKDFKNDFKFEVKYDSTLGNHTEIKKISFEEMEFDVVPGSTIVYRDCVYSTPEEQMDYLNECRPNSVMPSFFVKYRLPEYNGNGFTYELDENPQVNDPECLDIMNVNSSEYLAISDYMKVVMNDSGFTYSSYGDEVCLKKAYDKDYDLYLFVYYTPYVMKFRAYLVPFINPETATASYTLPRSVNGLNIPVDYISDNARFYLKTIDNYQCVFIFGTNVSEIEEFYSNLVAAGLLPDIELSHYLKAETDYGTYIVDMNNLEVVPYTYITVKRIG